MKVAVRRHDGDRPLIEYLDSRLFSEEERVDNVEESVWWVGWTDQNTPVAYAGARYIPSAHAVFLSRAGVLHEARGQGLQRRMIALRLRWARTTAARYVITYTHPENIISSNNLIKQGFLMYTPEWAWAGREFLYWIRENEPKER